MPTDPPPAITSSWFNVPGWAAYLACSWTWCIGMFLPVLLVRDFGILGFVVFAVPNVVGAAAMGWVLRRESQSRTITAQHAQACAWFSVVTIAFQLFFAFSVKHVVFAHSSRKEVWVLFPPALLVGVLTLLLPRLGSWIVWIGSVVLLLLAWNQRDWTWDVPAPLLPITDLVWLAPVCMFGFLLCPYLDLTFHHARQSCSAPQARGAFTLGFGGMFLLMILGTLTYTPAALGVLKEPLSLSRTMYAYLVAAHIGAQLGNTGILHVFALEKAVKKDWKAFQKWCLGMLATIVLVAIVLLLQWRGLAAWEIIYRCFMSFYGLVFPAYVWLCVIPTRADATTDPAEKARIKRRKFVVLCLAVIIAAPAFWMGFIERQTWWLGPGLAVVLLSRLLIIRIPQNTQAH